MSKSRSGFLFSRKATANAASNEATPTETARLELTLAEQPAKELNILVMGETGVGKSTLINAIANYLSFDSLDSVRSDDVLSLIPTKFHIYPDNSVVPVEISSKTLTVEKVAEANLNEELVQGQSSTQLARTYVFNTRLTSGDLVRVQLIDTPGMGDTRGIDRDKQNMRHIIGYISNYPQINAVLILLKPNNSRLTVWFRYCLQELLKSLHRECIKNLYFMFTHSRSTYYRHGDTLPALKSLLETIKHDIGLEIPINNTNTLMVDNEAYRFLLARDEVAFDPRQEADMRESWRRSSETLHRFLRSIADTASHNTEKTVLLFRVRAHVLELFKPLMDVTANIAANKRSLDQQIEAISNKYVTVHQLQAERKLTLLVPQKRDLDEPALVCAHPDCIKHVEKKEDGELREFKQKCHEVCYHGSWTSGWIIFSQVPIYFCPSINFWGYCRESQCGHHITWHSNVRYDYTFSVVDIINEEIQRRLDSEHDESKKIALAIWELESALRDLKAEEKRITAIAARFAVFIRHNGIVAYNDALLEYLAKLTEEETPVLQRHSSEGPIQPLDSMQSLRSMKETYEEEQRLLDNSDGEANVPLLSAEEIEALINELPRLKHSGEFFSTFQESQALRTQAVSLVVVQPTVPKRPVIR
ncbi:uncharacterized protein BJ171DRAFT_57121 [Polychytrium aggregatum]|uniref:uncharacterized protein n=1 Tax=Polychytrium aggregatum TaxID=110093 RepID=UPI0022FEE056|nr:uncharacterized protein BJ171DRAFT_57121 [Polychytrium aggregatum]KAI9190767.1 hypothetical protein BJ171DRAFT_57121 [Polychytrium aggregatum]